MAPGKPLHASEGAGTITIDVAAKLLMVTPEWIRRLSKDGWIAKTERGRYRVVDVVQGYVRFLKDEARRSTKTASHSRLQEIRARKGPFAHPLLAARPLAARCCG